MFDPIEPKEAPEEIYLHFESETTWCDERIDDEDVRYIRVSSLPSETEIAKDKVWRFIHAKPSRGASDEVKIYEILNWLDKEADE